jgi:uncharacterized protein
VHFAWLDNLVASYWPDIRHHRRISRVAEPSLALASSARWARAGVSQVIILQRMNHMLRYRLVATLAASILMSCTRSPDPVGVSWRMTSPGGAQLDLVPTLHVMRKGEADLPPSVKDLILKADVVAFEFDFHNPQLQQELAACNRLAWERVTSAPVSQAWQAETQKLLSARALGDAKPAANYAALASQLVALGMHGAVPELEPGIDHGAMQVALKHGKHVVSLESPCQQSEAGAQAAGVWTAETISERFDALAAGEPLRLIDALSAHWRTGSFSNMQEELQRFYARWPVEARASGVLVGSRNVPLSDALSALARASSEKRVVAFVGAFHFMGDHSLLHLLEARGLKIEASRASDKVP